MVCDFFFFEQRTALRGLEAAYTNGGYRILQGGPLASIAQQNLEFEEKASNFT
jgi:hypothetical protein